MRIIDCLQQSEEWDRWRNRPTASEFDKFVTPTRGEYSAQATAYAAKIVLKRRGIATDEPTPSYWMDWGIEHEPNAKHAYTLQTGRAVQDVGFIIPDGTDAYGGSPDGLVGDDGLIEIKCPKPETLVAYRHAFRLTGEMPVKYRPQVQGVLLISGRAWCDFFVFHPELEPLLIRVEADKEYQTRLAKCLLRLLEEIELIEPLVKTMRHQLVSVSTRKENMRFDDE